MPRKSPKHRRVAILGFADKGEGFDPKEVKHYLPWECWGANYAPQWTEEAGVTWSRFYQLHPWETADEYEIAWAKHCRRHHIPVYIHRTSGWREHALDWMARSYPLMQIRKTLLKGYDRGKKEDGFLASSWSYMVAHALYEGVTEIGLFGATLLAGNPRERMVEYPALLWWLGLAKGKGVKVTLPPGSQLLAYPYFYGKDYTKEVNWVRERVKDLSLKADEKIDEAWEPKGLPDPLAQVTP